MFAPPSLIRLIVTPAPPSLASATAIPTAPEKTFDRELFRPREMKAESCPVTVFIDEHGDVYAADLAACRADARLFMKSALLAWKYAPVVVDGKPVPAKFSVAVVLR